MKKETQLMTNDLRCEGGGDFFEARVARDRREAEQRSTSRQALRHAQFHSAALQLLLIICDHSHRRFAQLKLVAHFSEVHSQRFNLLLLFGYDRSLFLDLFVLFEELV